MSMKDIVICAIAKYENDYLKEWVDYHLSIGFDKIYIYDNNDLGDDSAKKILEEYIKEEKVVIFDVKGKTSLQLKVYNDFYYNYNNSFDYCAFIDLDEYIVFNQEQNIKNIKDFLFKYNKVDIYHLSWKVYGDNDKLYKEEGSCLKRFLIPKEDNFCFNYNFPENRHVKSIIKGNLKNISFASNPHTIKNTNPIIKLKCCNCDGKEVDLNSPFMTPTFNVCFIKHFYTKTLEEYVKNKIKRKSVSTNKDIYNLDKFFKYNKKTKEKIDYLKSIGINYE